MIKIIFLFFIILVFNACSLKTPINQWQYKTTSAFDAYTKNFLSSDEILAKNDFKRAVKHAKSGGSIEMLASLYLGKCALNISVGKDDGCREYQNISNLVEDKRLHSYFDLITNNVSENTATKIDHIYKKFTTFVYNKEYNKAKLEIKNIQKPTSKLLAASLIKDKLDDKTREDMIRVASFNGYKKSVLFWLRESKKYTTDKIKRETISKKIVVLESRY
jgi:hypothetical protein